MIITQTPLRISFCGGGTDFPDYFLQEGGCVLSSTIDKYIFVVIKERFDAKIRVGYTRTELVDRLDEVQHDLVRESLRRTGINRRVEISTMADIPSEGSGLGSSSTVTVGLLNAMYHYRGVQKEAESLAREACEIEINILGKPIGVQDQTIAAHGGLCLLRFTCAGAVEVERLEIADDVRRRFNQNLMLFYTGESRRAETVLTEQRENIPQRLDVLRALKGLVGSAADALRAGEIDQVGNLLNEAWQWKKRMASRISNGRIDEMYDAARRAGALGGKITGAGGGGFLLLYCRREQQDSVRSALKQLAELPFHLERDGSKVIFNYRR